MSHSQANPDRPFYKCSNPVGDCTSYFAWAGPKNKRPNSPPSSTPMVISSAFPDSPPAHSAELMNKIDQMQQEIHELYVFIISNNNQ